MAELTKERIEEIRARCEAATAGPWKWDRCWQSDYNTTHWAIINPDLPDGGAGDGFERVVNYLLVLRMTSEFVHGALVSEDPDFQFIAHTRQDVPDLLDALKSARAKIEQLERKIDRLEFRYEQRIGIDSTRRPHD
jgi:hypothetical protein